MARISQVPTSLITMFCRDLRKRNLILKSHPPLESTNEERLLTPLPNVLYAGFDPTADSFHIGNLLIITNLLRSSLFGCKPIALIGGATALIGDPSGRDTDRCQLPTNVVYENSKSLLKQLVEILENTKEMYGVDTQLTILNNMEWYEKMSMVDFLRMSSSFRVGTMLRQGPIKSRMVPGKGISFSEFSYSILQSYDWHVLSRKFDCFFQLGGSDQLGNIEFGYEYIRLRSQFSAAGICLPLLEDETGRKLGKSTLSEGSKAGVWLDEKRTSPYTFYQYFRQLHDDQAENFLRYFSLRPTNEVDEILIEHRKNLGKWIAQEHLASELTRLVHGSNKLEEAKTCSNILFNGSLNELERLNCETISMLFGEASTVRVKRNAIKTVGELANLTRLKKLTLESQINTESNEIHSRFDELIKSGAFKVNGQKLTNPEERFKIEQFLIKDQFSLICWGKRKYSLVHWT